MGNEKFKILDDGSLFISDIVVPIPDTISLEAQLYLGKKSYARPNSPVSASDSPKTIAELRQLMDSLQEAGSQRMAEIYPVHIGKEFIEGIECDVVTPQSASYDKTRIIINVCGGGGYWGHKNLMEAIPLANLLKAKIIKPHYKLMPEYSLIDASLDIEKIYEKLLPAYEPVNIGILGASNGASIVFQAIVRILFSGHPAPGAIVAWGGSGDLSKLTDSAVLNKYFDNEVRIEREKDLDHESRSQIEEGQNVDKKDPFVSPIYASNLSNFPPSLLTAGTRDVNLSSTTLMHRALLRAKAYSELIVFEAMPHRFMFFGDLPEAQELYSYATEFFGRMLGRSHGQAGLDFRKALTA